MNTTKLFYKLDFKYKNHPKHKNILSNLQKKNSK